MSPEKKRRKASRIVPRSALEMLPNQRYSVILLQQKHLFDFVKIALQRNQRLWFSTARRSGAETRRVFESFCSEPRRRGKIAAPKRRRFAHPKRAGIVRCDAVLDRKHALGQCSWCAQWCFLFSCFPMHHDVRSIVIVLHEVFLKGQCHWDTAACWTNIFTKTCNIYLRHLRTMWKYHSFMFSFSRGSQVLTIINHNLNICFYLFLFWTQRPGSEIFFHRRNAILFLFFKKEDVERHGVSMKILNSRPEPFHPKDRPVRGSLATWIRGFFDIFRLKSSLNFCFPIRGFSKFFQSFSFSEDFLASISEYLAPSRPLHLQGMELTSWNKWYIVHHHTVQISMDLCGDCWFGVPNLRVWANISLLRRNWRFKLLHNGHEHIWHSHPSSVFSKSSGHDPMVTSQWEIKTDKPQRPAPHSWKIWSSENLHTSNHLIYFLSQCINAWAVWWHWLPWAFSVQLASSVNVLTPRTPEKKIKLSVKSVETEGKRHYGRELSEKAHWKWTYIKNIKKSYLSEIQHHQNSNIRRVFSYFSYIFSIRLVLSFCERILWRLCSRGVCVKVTVCHPWRARSKTATQNLCQRCLDAPQKKNTFETWRNQIRTRVENMVRMFS